MKAILRAVAVAAAFLTASCATYNMTKAPPAQSKPIAVVISNEGASGWTDMPIGAYRVPGSSLIVTGHQKAGAGIFFGLVGVLASDAIDSSRGASKVKSEQDILKIDLVPQATTLTQTAIASGKYGPTFTATPSADGPTLLVTPYVVLTFATDTKVRTHVVLKTDLKLGTKNVWSTRYVSSTGPSMLLEGDGSLSANKGALLKDMMDKNLERAVGTMLDDVATRPVRDDKAMTYVEAGFPFLRQPFAIKGYQLADKGDYIVYAPKFADAMVLAGVYDLDKAKLVYRPATDADEIKMLDEEK